MDTAVSSLRREVRGDESEYFINHLFKIQKNLDYMKLMSEDIEVVEKIKGF